MTQTQLKGEYLQLQALPDLLKKADRCTGGDIQRFYGRALRYRHRMAGQGHQILGNTLPLMPEQPDYRLIQVHLINGLDRKSVV